MRPPAFLASSALVCSTIVGCLPVAAQSVCSGVSPTANTALSSVTVVSGLSLPLFVASPPGDTARLFVVEQAGTIRIHKKGDSSGTWTTFLNITSKVDSSSTEMGLLGLAFDPGYATTRRFYVNYTETVASQIYTVVARYTAMVGNPDLADPTSEVRILRIAQPEVNHKGGMLAFGPDGFFYVFMGDGGGTGDGHGTCGNGQNRSVLLGKILRIDVRGVDPAGTAPDCGLAGATYTVPSTNPFRDGPGTGNCDEIWSYGLRNPWRSTFDALNGDLYVADVGQNCWEEVNWVAGTSTGGENYGWRQMEGFHCYNLNQTFTCNPSGAVCSGSPPCNDPSINRPEIEYGHTAAGECAVTGGYAYRGCRMTSWQGTYFYGDYCAGFVRSFKMVGGVPTGSLDVTSQVDPGGTLVGSLTSFGVDAQGELFAISQNGFVNKFVPPFTDLEVSAPGAGTAFTLSKTGDWVWENLALATEVPVSFYRVYRGSLGGPYSCVFKALSPKWPAGGDPANPAPGQLFVYVVAAVNASGQQSRPGTVGTFNAATCP